MSDVRSSKPCIWGVLSLDFWENVLKSYQLWVWLQVTADYTVMDQPGPPWQITPWATSMTSSGCIHYEWSKGGKVTRFKVDNSAMQGVRRRWKDKKAKDFHWGDSCVCPNVKPNVKFELFLRKTTFFRHVMSYIWLRNHYLKTATVTRCRLFVVLEDSNKGWLWKTCLMEVQCKNCIFICIFRAKKVWLTSVCFKLVWLLLFLDPLDFLK